MVRATTDAAAALAAALLSAGVNALTLLLVRPPGVVIDVTAVADKCGTWTVGVAIVDE